MRKVGHDALLLVPAVFTDMVAIQAVLQVFNVRCDCRYMVAFLTIQSDRK